MFVDGWRRLGSFCGPKFPPSRADVNAFLPIELENPLKDEEQEALAFFEEMRIAPFDDKLDDCA